VNQVVKGLGQVGLSQLEIAQEYVSYEHLCL
jgi:hypothetical protein